VHFGLGKATKIDKLDVRWPSGQTDQFADVPVNQFLRLEEGSAKLVPFNRAGK
jgi:hypothetical protein